ncbi:MAG: hypothetical protein Kow0092_38380 [Deferrisomatales bacterium]
MDKDPFTLRGPDDFVRLDTLCAELLAAFFGWLQSPEGGELDPERASVLAHAADRYVRDFLVDIKETGPTDEDATLVSQYLANWYVIHTLTPSHEEVDLILEALDRLYDYLARRRLVSEGARAAVAVALSRGGFYHERLESFWDLTPEGIPEWRAVHDYRRPSPAT